MMGDIRRHTPVTNNGILQPRLCNCLLNLNLAPRRREILGHTLRNPKAPDGGDVSLGVFALVSSGDESELGCRSGVIGVEGRDDGVDLVRVEDGEEGRGGGVVYGDDGDVELGFEGGIGGA